MSSSYDIIPKTRTVPVGTIFKNKYDLYGTNAAGVNKADPDFGGDDIHIPVDSVLTFVEDRQMMAAGGTHPFSAWIRFHFIVNEKITWVTILRETSRIWNFETYPGKKRKITEAINEMFELIQLGEEKK